MLYVIALRPRYPYDYTRYWGGRIWVFQVTLAQQYSTYNSALYACNHLRVYRADYKIEVLKCRNSTI